MKSLNLTLLAAAAAWHTLTQTQVKGRVDARKHGKVSKALKAQGACMTPSEGQRGNFDFKEGVVSLDEDTFDYFTDIVDDQLERGVGGTHGEGYGDLVEEIQKHEPPKGK
jgi:hypothetical protein